MKSKKILALLMAITLSVTVALTGCNKSDAKPGSSSDGSDSGKPAVSDDASATDTGEVVTITYGGWERNLMALELAEKFNSKHKNIKVEIFNNGKWLNNAELTQLAATDQMPDIINIENILVPMQNDWLVDMSPYYEKDKEASNLPEKFIKYGQVNDKLVMLPSAMYLAGMLVNLDLLSANGIKAPGYDWTVDEFVEIIKKTTKRGATIGTNYVEPLMLNMPAQMNSKLGLGSFNEETKMYELGSEWEYGVQLTKDLLEADVSIWEDVDATGIPWDFEEGSAEREKVDKARADKGIEIVGEAESTDAWSKGKAATWFDYTYNLGFESFENYSGFEWDMYPIPTGKKGTQPRNQMVIDSIGITSSCKNPEAAYEFVKYLSFASEGIEDRMQVVKDYNVDTLKAKYPDVLETEYETPLVYAQMPVTNDKAAIAKWVEFTGAKPGVKYMLERMDTAYADGYKVTPGFNDAYYGTVQKAIYSEIFTGKRNAADIAKELETKANEITKAAYEALK